MPKKHGKITLDVSCILHWKGSVILLLPNFTELRKAKGLSLAKIAEEFGITKQAVQKWDASSVIPNEYAERVCTLLGIAFEDQATFTGEFIQKFRKEIGMNISDFAIMIDVNPSNVIRWESGETEMTSKRQQRLYEYYKRIVAVK